MQYCIMNGSSVYSNLILILFSLLLYPSLFIQEIRSQENEGETIVEGKQLC